MNETLSFFSSHRKPDVDDRRLDPSVFRELNARFEFTVDVAATAQNAQLPKFYTWLDNGLKQSWAGERVYCNPPFSDIDSWCVKARAETQAPLIVMLLPANRTEQEWWQTHIEPLRDRGDSVLSVEFLPNRIRFLKPGQTAFSSADRPRFGCCLAIWRHYSSIRY